VAGAVATPCPDVGECWRGLPAMFGGIGGALAGLITGGIVGSFVEHEEWTLVALPPRSE